MKKDKIRRAEDTRPIKYLYEHPAYGFSEGKWWKPIMKPYIKPKSPQSGI